MVAAPRKCYIEYLTKVIRSVCNYIYNCTPTKFHSFSSTKLNGQGLDSNEIVKLDIKCRCWYEIFFYWKKKRTRVCGEGKFWEDASTEIKNKWYTEKKLHFYKKLQSQWW